MKKTDTGRMRWYWIVILVLVLVFSAASWILTGGAVRKALAANAAEQEASSANTAAKEPASQASSSKSTASKASSSADPKNDQQDAGSGQKADSPGQKDTASGQNSDTESQKDAGSGQKTDTAGHPASAAGQKAAASVESEAAATDQAPSPSIPRRLARKVKALCAAVDAAIDKAESYWTVPVKKELSNIDTVVTYFGTREVASVQVLAGKGKWLFYKSKNDADPIGDYEGTKQFTQAELDKIAGLVGKLEDKLEKRGTRLAVIFAPNKENIYWENMPDTYVRAEETRTDKLAAFLAEKGFNSVSPKQELLDQHLSTQLYYYYDTHWNQLGGYIGARKLLAGWGISIPDLAERTYTTWPLRENYHYNGQDDLAKMAGLRSILDDETEYEIEGAPKMDWPDYEYQQSHKIMTHFTNEDAPHKARVFLAGDSFRSALLPALREQFSDVYVTLRADYRPEMLEEADPDYMILEFVERYSHQIMRIGPMLE
ncbi:MAG: hypothetical protein E7238_03450 [Sarcina sp.]|nr:hypothetical protein [Sarcina sp.]